MASQTYGIIVEGIYDEAVLSRLTARLCDAKLVASRVAGDKPRLIRLFPSLLWTFRYIPALQGPPHLALVIADADSDTPEALEDRLQRCILGRRYPFRDGVVLHAVVHTIETWLLADMPAVQRLGETRGVNVSLHDIPGPLEDIPDPKARLTNILHKAALPPSPAVYGAIADALDLNVLRRRCSSFARLESKILGS